MPIHRAHGPPLLLLVSNPFYPSTILGLIRYLRPMELDRVPRGTGSMLNRLPLLLAADEGGLVIVRLDKGLDPMSVVLSSSGDSRSWSSSVTTDSLFS